MRDKRAKTDKRRELTNYIFKLLTNLKKVSF
jgi:hypothetical protein